MLQPLWAWAILGLVLLSVEMLSGTFYILWFGIAALCVAALLALFPQTSFAVQLLAFSVLSLGSLALWRRKYRGRTRGSRIGQAQDDSIGRIGTLLESASREQNGRIQFTVPLMGSREWIAIADETIAAGEQAEVIAVEGNYLRVRRSPS